MPKSPRKTPTKRGTRGRAASAAPTSAGGKSLVIVESPAKAKTINRYLGDNYVVRASLGHVRDLPRKEMGVDIEHDFAPTYEPLDGRRKVLAELKRLARTASNVYLATDLDREGEAIAWHLAESLGISGERVRRVVFNQITKDAIQEAFVHPRQIDLDKVNAQQARRILDRIVGYEISPLLWRKVAPGLSAGRVQSVAVELIVLREREIDAFDPAEYWKIGGVFTADIPAAAELGRRWAGFMSARDEKGNPPTRDAQQAFLADCGAFRAELVSWDGERFSPDSADAAMAIARALGLSGEKIDRSANPKGKGVAANVVSVSGGVSAQAGPFTVSRLARRESRSNPPAPFTTASLQQAASVQLRYSASRTMRLAQQLYEGIDIPGEGGVGLITYMRTDSTHLALEAVAQVRSLIADSYGARYVPDKPRTYAAGQRAQEAHEAVRPADATRRPEDLRGALDESQMKLYDLIWRRFVASQMSSAVWQVTEADIAVETGEGRGVFKAVGRTLAFDGYLAVAGRPRGGEQILPPLSEGEPVAPAEILPTQHFTQPPPRYTEASLVKALEAEGIGRPSTYASIIQTIQDRGYVEQENRAFRPTDLGIVVTDKLMAHFPRVMSISFTAHMEDRLDRVEEHQAGWIDVLREFYGPFNENLQRAREEMVHAKAESDPSEYTCENCGRPMVYRFSKAGRYLACTGYPDCKTTHPVDKEGKKVEKVAVDVACPVCGKAMVLRKGRFGPFLSCSGYPECKGIVNLDRKGNVKLPSAPPLEVEIKCPKCGSPQNLRRSKRGPWLSCSKYPKCRGRVGWKTLDEARQKQLELAMMNHEKANPQPTITRTDGTPIGEGEPPRPLDAAVPAARSDDEEAQDLRD
jgi:DNA topoisomerase-1